MQSMTTPPMTDNEQLRSLIGEAALAIVARLERRTVDDPAGVDLALRLLDHTEGVQRQLGLRYLVTDEDLGYHDTAAMSRAKGRRA